MALKGRVEKFARIRPERINLRGEAGETLAAEVEITPRPEYPFTIRSVRAKKGYFIKYELIRRCTDGQKSCLIRVENMKKDRGRYVDALFIETDSRIKRQISIYVMGRIN